MKFHLKDKVSCVGIRPELTIGLMIASSVWDEFQIPGGLVVTSLTDGRGIHQDGSLHFVGLAADLRTNPYLEGGVPAPLLTRLVDRLRDELGEEWDLIQERTHLHMEFQIQQRKEKDD
jgi:hypothetical protein